MSIVSKVNHWDEQMVIDLALRRKVRLTQLMAFVTRLGDGWAWLMIAMCVVLFDPLQAPLILSQFVCALILEIIAYSILKKSFSRQRPFRKCEFVSCVVAPRDEFSFPSGHTAAAFVAVMIIGFSYPWLLPALCILAVLIGISRVYLGVHYPSDVMAGMILGILCGEIVKGFF